MGYCAEPSPEMGEYSVESRRESFFIRGEDAYEAAKGRGRMPLHVLHVYPVVPDAPVGSVEFLTSDIPKLRAALDQAEALHYLDAPVYERVRHDPELLQAALEAARDA